MSNKIKLIIKEILLSFSLIVAYILIGKLIIGEDPKGIGMVFLYLLAVIISFSLGLILLLLSLILRKSLIGSIAFITTTITNLILAIVIIVDFMDSIHPISIVSLIFYGSAILGIIQFILVINHFKRLQI